MDAPMFLNASGAIVTRFAENSSGYDEALPITPFVENVQLPFLAIDASAIQRGEPENMVSLVYSSGAAITFFCDSVAGGSNSSGDGSFENPWRSMRTASSRLACYECALSEAGYDYIQLKVTGTIDYFTSSMLWSPMSVDSNMKKLLVTGAGESRVDLGLARYCGGYFRNVRGQVGTFGGSDGMAYNCTVIPCNLGSRYSQTVCPAYVADCEISSGIKGDIYGSALYHCSGAFTSPFGMVLSSVVADCDFSWNGTASSYQNIAYINADCIYRTSCSVIASGVSSGYDPPTVPWLYLAFGYCGYSHVNLTLDGFSYAAGIVCSGIAVSNTVSIDAVASYTKPSACTVGAGVVGVNCPIVSGGSVYISAEAYASATSPEGSRCTASASAIANAYGGDNHIIGGTITLNATATAHGEKNASNYVEEYELEEVYNGLSSSWERRSRSYLNGEIVSSTTSSGTSS